MVKNSDRCKSSLAKPSEAKLLTSGAETLRVMQVDSIRLFAIPALTVLLGTVTDFLTITGNMLSLSLLKSR